MFRKFMTSLVILSMLLVTACSPSIDDVPVDTIVSDNVATVIESDKGRVVQIENDMFYDTKLQCVCRWTEGRCLPFYNRINALQFNSFTNSKCNFPVLDYMGKLDGSMGVDYCGVTLPDEKGNRRYYKWTTFTEGKVWTTLGATNCVIKLPEAFSVHPTDPVELLQSDFATK